LVPGGNSVLAASASTGEIYDVSLNDPGQTPTTFGSGQYRNGIAYDSSGRLFAVSNSSSVVELDPNSFNVIASTGALQGLDGLAFDPVTGNLFVSSRAINSESGRAGLYEVSLQPGNFLQATLITSSSFPTTFSPDGLESDGQGNIYLASQGAASDQRIYRYNITTGTLAALSSALSGLDDIVPLSGVGAHSVPDYWFFEETAGKFGAINPTTGSITETPPLITPNAQVNGITNGPDGTIWFTEFNTNKIGMIDTDTDAITEFTLPTPGAEPYGIIEGPDANMWFAEAGADQIGSINPATHVIQEFPIDSSGNGEPEGITVGPDSNLWFTLTGTDEIGVMGPYNGRMVGEYSVPTVDAGLEGIVSDSADGNLWFTETAADQIGRINPTTGIVSEFAVPTAGALPTAITVDKQGNIWFTESNETNIAEFSPQSPSHIVEFLSFDQATTYTFAANSSIPFNPSGQTVPLTASVTSSSGTVNEGTATFTVVNGATVIGSPVTVNVVSGMASADYVLPPGIPSGTYTIEARYNGTPDFTGSSDSGHSLTINPPLPPALFFIHTEPPAGATAGNAFATGTSPVVVYEEDQYGELETGDNTTVVTASLASGAGPLDGTLTATVTGGVATFADLWDDTAGPITIQFTGGGLAAGTSNKILVASAPATHLVVTNGPPSPVVAGQPFAIVVTAEDLYGNTDPSFGGSLTASISNEPGFPTTVQALSGVATFTALTVDASAQGRVIVVVGGGLPQVATSPINLINRPSLTPTITGESVTILRKTNKNGKPVGKPVLTGYRLDFSEAMSPTTAGNQANYVIKQTTIKKTGRKTVTKYLPVRLTANDDAASNSVSLMLIGKPAFAQGGVLIVIDTPPGGVSSATGDPLSGGTTVFAIAPKGNRITSD
jgi:virginiamycin B lyase